MVDPVRTSDVRPTRTARPVALLARTVLEQAKTLDEAVKLIETTPTLGAAVIVVVDGTSGTWVLVERTPSKAIIERNPKQPAFVTCSPRTRCRAIRRTIGRGGCSRRSSGSIARRSW